MGVAHGRQPPDPPLAGRLRGGLRGGDHLVPLAVRAAARAGLSVDDVGSEQRRAGDGGPARLSAGCCGPPCCSWPASPWCSPPWRPPRPGWARLSARTSTCSTRSPGVVIIAAGLMFAGLLRPAWLLRERRWHVAPSQLGEWAAPVMGMAFAFGWTPCIGPVLAAVLSLASDTHTLGRGEAMLVAYSLGLGVPFVVAGVAFGRLTGVFALRPGPSAGHQRGLRAAARRPRGPPAHRQPARAVHLVLRRAERPRSWRRLSTS